MIAMSSAAVRYFNDANPLVFRRDMHIDIEKLFHNLDVGLRVPGQGDCLE